MSHTPGPWKILRHDLGDEEICSVPVEIRGGNGRLVVADEGGLAPAAYEWTAEEIEANASLIAAAPELLEALKRLEYQSEVSLESADPARVAARTAIAKARGEK